MFCPNVNTLNWWCWWVCKLPCSLVGSELKSSPFHSFHACFFQIVHFFFSEQSGASYSHKNKSSSPRHQLKATQVRTHDVWRIRGLAIFESFLNLESWSLIPVWRTLMKTHYRQSLKRNQPIANKRTNRALTHDARMYLGISPRRFGTLEFRIPEFQKWWRQ